MPPRQLDLKKYIYSFVITAIIFATAIYVSNYLGQKKLDDIRNIQDKISIDLLSSETQYSLLENSSCKDFTATSSLSTELGTLEDKLAYTEDQRGVNDPEVRTLKQYYSLLEIKDYLLMNKIADKCHKTALSIIYFYSDDNNCADCTREGYVLTSLRQTYPEFRIYSFDYNIGISAVNTLIATNKITRNLPAIIYKDKIFYGFQSIDDLVKNIPELAQMKAKAESANATSTKK